MPMQGAAPWRTRFVLSAKAQTPKLQLLGTPTPDARSLVGQASAALDAGARPTLVEDGLGGTYFIRSLAGVQALGLKPWSFVSAIDMRSALPHSAGLAQRLQAVR